MDDRADFSLRVYVKERIGESFPEVPKALANEIADELPEAVLRQALAEALPNYVRVAMTNAQRPTPKQWDALTDGDEPPEMMVRGEAEWKPLAECSPGDLHSLAHRRIRQSEGNEAWARRFVRLAEGTGLTAPAAERRDVHGSLATLLKRRERLKRDLAEHTSPELRELQRRKEALLELRAIREAEMHRFALLEDVLRDREVAA